MHFSELRLYLLADLMRLYKSHDAIKIKGLFFFIRVFHPRVIPVLLIRLSCYCHNGYFLRPFSFIFSLINVVLFGIEVTPRCKIGPGLMIPHTVGTVIGAYEIGENFTIFQNVTLGATYADLAFDSNSRPIVGDNVLIGAGAKVLGNIEIGSNTIIAANSLVIESIPKNAFAIGVPAIVKVRE
jgi:serine O-acetyltransferase